MFVCFDFFCNFVISHWHRAYGCACIAQCPGLQRKPPVISYRKNILTSVCCYSELLQEPEKFKKSQTRKNKSQTSVRYCMDVTYLGWRAFSGPLKHG